MAEVETTLLQAHYVAYVGLLSCYFVLWSSKRDYEAPYRPYASRTPLSLVWGIWGRCVFLYSYALSGIWYLHLNQVLLTELTTRLRIVASVTLFILDQFFVSAMRPTRPQSKPTGRRTTNAIFAVALTLTCLMWF